MRCASTCSDSLSKILQDDGRRLVHEAWRHVNGRGFRAGTIRLQTGDMVYRFCVPISSARWNPSVLASNAKKVVRLHLRTLQTPRLTPNESGIPTGVTGDLRGGLHGLGRTRDRSGARSGNLRHREGVNPLSRTENGTGSTRAKHGSTEYRLCEFASELCL